MDFPHFRAVSTAVTSMWGMTSLRNITHLLTYIQFIDRSTGSRARWRSVWAICISNRPQWAPAARRQRVAVGGLLIRGCVHVSARTAATAGRTADRWIYFSADGRTDTVRPSPAVSAINHLFFMRCTITLQWNWADLRMGRGGPCLSQQKRSPP